MNWDKKIIPELKVLYPSVKSVSISHALELTVDSVRIDTVTLAVLKFGKHPDAREREENNRMAESAYGFRKAEADCGVMSGCGEREASGRTGCRCGSTKRAGKLI